MKKYWILCTALLLFILYCEKKEEVEMMEVRIPPGVSAHFVQNLPHPFFENHQHLEDLYWITWRLLEEKIAMGTPQNGFVERYLDEGFNELIYQWDTCFMAAFAMYGRNIFPAMESLDNFYRNQRPDGWICRVYRESDGQPAELPTAGEPMINPPLFAFIEWKYFLLSGDRSRFERIVPILDAYYNWIEKNCRGEAAAGLYFNTALGSGMDNSPRHGIQKGAWVDLSAQMALFAKYMMFISRELQADSLSKIYEQRYRLLVRLINSQLWDGESGFYYDMTSEGEKIPTKTVAAFWTLLPEVTMLPQAQKLAEHLQNPDEFYRDHLFPTLSADHPDYDPHGNYWRGGVWAPINYMIIKGLDIYPLRELAAVAALNHIENMYRIYAEFHPDENQIAPEERDGDYQTIWECYAPDFPTPATRWDGQYLCRQDFVGWSGLGPVALLLENVIGLQPSAPRDELYWNLRLRERHGVENYQFGDNVVDIICQSNQLPVEAALIRVHSNSPFNLIVSSQVGVREFRVQPGENSFRIEL
ncbi:MAG: trehalase family glycosidase [Calditrichia bacterium]